MSQRCPQCLYHSTAAGGTVAAIAECPRCRGTMTGNLGDSRTQPSHSFLRHRPESTMVGHVNGLPLSVSGYETLSQTQATSRIDVLEISSHENLSAVDTPSAPATTHTPKHIPGYQIEGVVGLGGMGAVYKARQLNLDRIVALKVMNPTWASDPVFVARFVREAYAAASLNHPNVVQIHDIGEADSCRYFSMEFVEGQSIGAIIKQQGKLSPEIAVEYILQAARGLKHAHDRGIIHRDIKPDNLLLDEHGTVKVADLGLVKTPAMTQRDDRLATGSSASGMHTLPTDMTGVRMALGTPAYMAPEQCRDAAAVDHRADIYSLGCTLYMMVTGRQPFDAKSMVSLMKKQAYEPLTPPEEINPRISAELSSIIQKMMAKLPADRYSHMDEVIRVLEHWLGIQSTVSRFVPRDEQVAEAEQLAYRFQHTPATLLHQRLTNGFVSLCALAALLMLFFGKIGWAFGLAGMVVQATVAYFVIRESSQKSTLYRQVQQFFRGMSLGDWLVAAAGLGAVTALLATSKLLLVWLGFGMLGLAATGLFWIWVERRRTAERQPIVDAARLYVKTLRHQGVSKDDVQLFLARHAGPHWEEYFEAVFDYPAKITMRGILSRGANPPREKYGAWREPLLALLNQVEAARRKQREQAMIERTEYQRLIAAGVPRREARTRSRHCALKIVERSPSKTPSLTSAHSLQMPGLEEPPEDLVTRIAGAVVSAPVRVVLATGLLALCGLWIVQNELFSGVVRETSALVIPGLPLEWTAWCDTVNVGWGGMLLFGSLFYQGQRMAALSILGAGITVLGHKFGIRTIEPIQTYQVSLFLGTVITLIAYRIGRK